MAHSYVSAGLNVKARLDQQTFPLIFYSFLPTFHPSHDLEAVENRLVKFLFPGLIHSLKTANQRGTVPMDGDQTASAHNWVDIRPIRGGKHVT